MSWHNRTFLTKEEAKEVSTTDLLSLFKMGDEVSVYLEMDESVEAPWLPGVITGISYTAGQVNYDVGFLIAGTNTMVNVKQLRTHMVRRSDGEASNFLSWEEFEPEMKNIKFEEDRPERRLFLIKGGKTDEDD